jgi:uncharacterized tellurite resistance protein B-like protein
MNMSQELTERFRQETGAEPIAIARALYDLDGQIGETYTAANERFLVLFHRPLGGSYRTMVLQLSHITTLTTRVVSTFAFLEIEVPTAVFKLQYSYWDLPELETIVSCWQQQPSSSDAFEAVSQSMPPRSLLPAELTPLIAFCAALHALMSRDTRVDMVELHYLTRRIASLETVRQGQRYFDTHGLDHLLECLNRMLNPRQKRCLLANLMALAMEDGVLTSGEQELLDEFGRALVIPEALSQGLFETLMLKNNLTVLVNPSTAMLDAGGLSPLAAFCVAMQIMMNADELLDKEELELISRIIPEPEIMQTASAFRDAYAVDDLIEMSAAALDQAQRQCLMANLISMAMADGQVAPSEQGLLERFRSALGIRAAEFDTRYETLQCKNNLAIFATP